MTAIRTAALVFAALACSAGTTAAQTYPVKPVRIIVGLAPGGTTDIVARTLAHQLVFSLNVMALGAAGGVAPDALKEVLKRGLANSAVLQVWHDLGPRWKGMLEATAPGATPPNMRKDLHLVLELARELGVNLYLGTQGSLIADAGIATGRGDPRL